MAIAFVRNTTSAGSSPLSQNLSALPASGNLLVVGISNITDGTATISSITDNASNTYTRAISSTYASGYANTEIWYAKNVVPAAAIQTLTITCAAPATNIFVVVDEYSGVDTIAPLDKTSWVNTAGSTTVNAGPTGTLIVADELVVMVGSDIGNRVFTVGAGYSNFNQSTGTAPISIQSKVVAATTAVSGTMTIASSADNTGLIATFTILGSLTTSTSSSTSTTSISTSVSTSLSTSVSTSSTSSSLSTSSTSISTSSTSSSISTSASTSTTTSAITYDRQPNAYITSSVPRGYINVHR